MEKETLKPNEATVKFAKFLGKLTSKVGKSYLEATQIPLLHETVLSERFMDFMSDLRPTQQLDYLGVLKKSSEGEIKRLTSDNFTALLLRQKDAPRGTTDFHQLLHSKSHRDLMRSADPSHRS
jgi:hypothetical protein